MVPIPLFHTSGSEKANTELSLPRPPFTHLLMFLGENARVVRDVHTNKLALQEVVLWTGTYHFALIICGSSTLRKRAEHAASLALVGFRRLSDIRRLINVFLTESDGQISCVTQALCTFQCF